MKNTNIEWCHHTFNAWEGCTKVSPGCDNCYAEERNERFHAGKNWGPRAPRLLRSDAYWRDPIKWNSNHDTFFAEHGCRQLVFSSSLADVFDNEAPAGQRERLFDLIRTTPNLDWLLLTKRIGNAKSMLPADWGNGYPNVWLGATIVNQEEADRDIPKLLAVPAAKRFLSMEPLLGPVNLTRIDPKIFAASINALTGNWKWDNGPIRKESAAIDWVIVGGESSSDARPMHSQWARDIRNQCVAAGVPFLFKQWGSWVGGTGEKKGFIYLQNGINACGDKNTHEWGNGSVSQKMSKNSTGRLLDGIQHDGYPEGR